MYVSASFTISFIPTLLRCSSSLSHGPFNVKFFFYPPFKRIGVNFNQTEPRKAKFVWWKEKRKEKRREERREKRRKRRKREREPPVEHWLETNDKSITYEYDGDGAGGGWGSWYASIATQFLTTSHPIPSHLFSSFFSQLSFPSTWSDGFPIYHTKPHRSTRWGWSSSSSSYKRAFEFRSVAGVGVDWSWFRIGIGRREEKREGYHIDIQRNPVQSNNGN